MRKGDRLTPTGILAIVGVIVARLPGRRRPVFVRRRRRGARTSPRSTTSARSRRRPSTTGTWSSRSSRSPARRSRSRRRRSTASRAQALKQQVMQFLISSDWIVGEAQGARPLGQPRRDPEASSQQTKKQSFPNEKAYQKFLATSGQTVQDLLFRVRLDVLSNKIREDVTKGTSNVSEGDDQGLLRQERAAVLAARAPRPRGDPDQDPGQGEPGQAAGRVRREVGLRSRSSSRPTRPRRTRAASCSASRRASRTRLSTRRSSRAVKGKIAGPVKTGAGFYVFRVTKVTPATQAEPAGLDRRASASCSSRRTSRRSSTSSRPTSATTGARRPTAPRST